MNLSCVFGHKYEYGKGDFIPFFTEEECESIGLKLNIGINGDKCICCEKQRMPKNKILRRQRIQFLMSYTPPVVMQVEPGEDILFAKCKVYNLQRKLILNKQKLINKYKWPNK